MELNDDILVRSTPLRTIARVKRVKSRLLQKVAQKMRANVFCRTNVARGTWPYAGPCVGRRHPMLNNTHPPLSHLTTTHMRR